MLSSSILYVSTHHVVRTHRRDPATADPSRLSGVLRREKTVSHHTRWPLGVHIVFGDLVDGVHIALGFDELYAWIRYVNA